MTETTAQAIPELLYLLHGDPAELATTLHEMRAADVADALNRLRHDTPGAAVRVLAALPFDFAVQVLDEPELEHAGELLTRLAAVDPGAGTALVEAMSADRQADLFRELPDAERARLLRGLTRDTKRALELLLRYPPTTAGGIMTTELVAVPPYWTVDRTLRHISHVGGAKETVYAIYVVEGPEPGALARATPAGTADVVTPAGRLHHVVSLRELLMADRARRVGDVGDRRTPLSVGPFTDREEVARLISRYDLLAVPVVDEHGSLLGIVTVDDVIDAIIEEHTEDVHRFGGVEALDARYTEIGFWMMIRKRAGWLTALFLGEMLTAAAMGHFEHEIQAAVVLALFVPLIISSGGNSGSQATSLIIRSLALRELELRDWWRVAWREIPTGLTLGAILGTVGILRILLWQALGWYDYGPHYLLVALTVGLALVGVVLFGSLAGSMLPFVLRRLGFDPASASAPFVATLVDVTGLMIYFTVAALILR
ncbi:MAG TPA: magnesium transporter, partial [Gemmatimonadaceae bacterium]|nr:magnesium transporter [Gemmatimonadaceae bacterium]